MKEESINEKQALVHQLESDPPSDQRQQEEENKQKHKFSELATKMNLRPFELEKQKQDEYDLSNTTLEKL